MVRDDAAVAPPSGSAEWAAGLWSLFEAHGRDVYRFVHRRCGDPSMAEEVTQDVFLAALQAGPNPGCVSVEWLYRVARNRMIDMLRRQDTYEAKLRLVARAGGGDDHAVDVVDRVRMEAALAGLSSLHRGVLMLRYVDGLSVRELAEAFARTERGVEALLMRARSALRQALEASDE